MDNDPFADLGEDAAQAKAQRQAQEALDEAVRWLLGDARGRLVAWWLLEQAGVFRTSFAGAAEHTAFNEGRRDLGLRLLHRVMDVDADAYLRMVKERKDA